MGYLLLAISCSVNGVAHSAWPIAMTKEERMVFNVKKEEIKLHGRLVALD